MTIQESAILQKIAMMLIKSLADPRKIADLAMAVLAQSRLSCTFRIADFILGNITLHVPTLVYVAYLPTLLVSRLKD